MKRKRLFAVRCSLQPGILRLGLLKNRDVWVGVLPQFEEVLIGAFGLADVARDNGCPAELQVRQGANGIGKVATNRTMAMTMKGSAPSLPVTPTKIGPVASPAHSTET